MTSLSSTHVNKSTHHTKTSPSQLLPIFLPFFSIFLPSPQQPPRLHSLQFYRVQRPWLRAAFEKLHERPRHPPRHRRPSGRPVGQYPRADPVYPELQRGDARPAAAEARWYPGESVDGVVRLLGEFKSFVDITSDDYCKFIVYLWLFFKLNSEWMFCRLNTYNTHITIVISTYIWSHIPLFPCHAGHGPRVGGERGWEHADVAGCMGGVCRSIAPHQHRVHLCLGTPHQPGESEEWEVVDHYAMILSVSVITAVCMHQYKM